MDQRTDPLNLPDVDDERAMTHLPATEKRLHGIPDDVAGQFPGEVEEHEDEAMTTDDTDDPTAIRHSIEHTRQDMGRTIDAIQERLSPQHLINQATETVKEATIGRVQDMATNIRYSAADAGNSVMDTVRQNPIPAAMAGIGLGWLIYRSMSSAPQSPRRYYPEQPYPYQRRYGAAYSQSRATYDYSDIDRGRTMNQPSMGDRVNDATQQARDKAGEFAGQVQERMGQIGDQVQERASDLGDAMHSGASQTRDWFGNMMQENPLVMGLAALAVGAAVGFAVKETPQENRLMGEMHDNVMQKAQDVAQDTAQKVQQVAKKVADTAKDEAQRQGLVNQS